MEVAANSLLDSLDVRCTATSVFEREKHELIAQRNDFSFWCNISSMGRSVPSPGETLRRELKKYEAQRNFFDELRSKVEFITCVFYV